MTNPFEDEFEHTIVNVRPSGGGGEPDAVGHYLVSIEGPEPGRRVEIGAEPLTIGRDVRQTLVFAADTELSRAHARVSLVNDEVVVEDLRSTNGTFVNAGRISESAVLREGSVLRTGRQLFRYERRSRRDVAQAHALERDLLKASHYVRSMLPEPLRDGRALADWSFQPSAQLGGDGFGYHWLDAQRFVVYLLDVSGHGVGAAMHAVSVLNVLRQRALPHVDFADPAAVLSSLNERFQMDDHNGLFFTIWYGVYRTADSTIAYSTAGHHPAYLVSHDRRTSCPLGQADFMIGAMPGHAYQTQETHVPPGSCLYLFSDGVFEIVASDERQWSLADFVPLLLEPALPGIAEPERLYRRVRSAARPGSLDDDCSLLAVTFP
jgi:serine phosphatase RsbU (regulator of sigma subunit)